MFLHDATSPPLSLLTYCSLFSVIPWLFSSISYLKGSLPPLFYQRRLVLILSLSLTDSSAMLCDSNEISNDSAICCLANNISEPPGPDTAALRRLSDNLESIFDTPDSDDFFADARIVLGDGREVPVHRCILSARSPFFKSFFSGGCAKLELKEVARDYVVGFDALVGVVRYLYSGRVRSLPKQVCECVDDNCSHLWCRPALDFMVQLLYASSTFEISDLVTLYQVTPTSYNTSLFSFFIFPSLCFSVILFTQL